MEENNILTPVQTIEWIGGVKDLDSKTTDEVIKELKKEYSLIEEGFDEVDNAIFNNGITLEYDREKAAMETLFRRKYACVIDLFCNKDFLARSNIEQLAASLKKYRLAIVWHFLENYAGTDLQKRTITFGGDSSRFKNLLDTMSVYSNKIRNDLIFISDTEFGYALDFIRVCLPCPVPAKETGIDEIRKLLFDKCGSDEKFYPSYCF